MSVLESLKVAEVAPGWQSLENYLAIKGTIPVGNRVAKLPNADIAAKVLPTLDRVVVDWPTFRRSKPIVQEDSGVADAVYPYTAFRGFSVHLVELADSLLGKGGWRVGRSQDAAPGEPVLVKVRKGEAVALIAPATIGGIW